MRERMYLNDGWYYAPEPNADIIEVRIPHTNIETPLNYFDENAYQFVSCYSKNIYAEEQWMGKRVFLTFEGVAHIARVFVGEQFVGEHRGGYTAFTFDIAPFLHWGMENTVMIEVDARESSNIPPFGHVIDYMTYGGIYRDVYMEIKEETYIKDVFVKAKERVVLEDVEVNVEENDVVDIVQQEQLAKYLSVDVDIEGNIEGVELVCEYKGVDEEDWKVFDTSEVEKNQCTIESEVADIKYWNLENPNLYQLKLTIKQDGILIDNKMVTFGYRISEFRKDGFYLNHQKIKLRGLNRHQSYPYVGYAMPKRPQQFDVDILKYELALNAVRTSHYPQSHHFLERCDELGLLVFTEIPGWQHIGDEAWKEAAVDMACEMVTQYRNHPSIILWGARINESQDDDRLYRRINKVIHGLDDTRQTGGVRFIKNSNLLEDVYTYNDFSHTGNNPGLEPKSKVTKELEAPYLVSEYNGHMFPTKSFDSERLRLEHAKRHANVLESFYAMDEIAGAFGWCMFDYNTHKDFGSGDRICYHGVMNMFRIPKLAASVYASQGEDIPVLEISSSMDIGEYPAIHIEEVYAFTNADYVRLYKNDEFVKDFYPNKEQYGHMPHPPILIDDFIGELMEKKEKFRHKNAESIKSVMRAITKYGQYQLPLKYKLKMAKVMMFEKLTMEDGMRLYYEYAGNWGSKSTTYRFEGIKDEEVVRVVEKTATKQIALRVTTDTEVLEEGHTYDVATVRVEVVNEMGQVLPYYQGVIIFETMGPIEIVGPKAVTAIGGCVGTYVKTTGRYGVGTLKVAGYNLEEVHISYDILKEE